MCVWQTSGRTRVRLARRRSLAAGATLRSGGSWPGGKPRIRASHPSQPGSPATETAACGRIVTCGSASSARSLARRPRATAVSGALQLDDDAHADSAAALAHELQLTRADGACRANVAERGRRPRGVLGCHTAETSARQSTRVFSKKYPNLQPTCNVSFF